MQAHFAFKLIAAKYIGCLQQNGSSAHERDLVISSIKNSYHVSPHVLLWIEEVEDVDGGNTKKMHERSVLWILRYI